jgi:hypothetical protein
MGVCAGWVADIGMNKGNTLHPASQVRNKKYHHVTKKEAAVSRRPFGFWLVVKSLGFYQFGFASLEVVKQRSIWNALRLKAGITQPFKLSRGIHKVRDTFVKVGDALPLNERVGFDLFNDVRDTLRTATHGIKHGERKNASLKYSILAFARGFSISAGSSAGRYLARSDRRLDFLTFGIKLAKKLAPLFDSIKLTL